MVKMQSMIELYQKGYSYDEISKMTGLSEMQITYAINKLVEEKRKKSLAKIGQRSNKSKLSDEQVFQLLVDYNEHMLTTRQLEAKYNISKGYPHELIRGKSRTDNDEINEYRKKIVVRNERTKRKAPIAVKEVKTELHFSVFNNENK